MPIPRGTRIGVNEVIALIGVGGMGEVYRARDTRLGRDVAIKVLANRLSSDAVVRARIEREARLLASLNHPNIATIYSVEEYEGSPAIVMELIEGETLNVKLIDGALPVDQAMDIGRQVSAALTAAHERGIVHRDLKPANIHLRPDGTVKVLDFGLAKAVTQSDTRLSTPSVTTTGSIIGTASYMSPEQARGLETDHRTDIWSFGCLLFELLTGHPAFNGATPADTLVMVLKSEPDWSRLPAATPPRVRTLLERCIEKDVANRLADPRDAGISGPSRVAAPRRFYLPRQVRSRALTTGAILATSAALAWVVWTLIDRDPPEAPLRKFEVIAAGLGDDPYAYSDSVGPGAGVVISPDGQRIVYPASGRLWVRELSQLDARELDGTATAGAPSWSPDSEWVAYAVGDQLRKSPITGGPAVTIATLTGRFIDGAGAGWLPGGDVFYSAGNDGVWRVSAGGGTPEQVIDVETGLLHYRDVSTAGGRVLFVSRHINGDSSIDTIEAGKRQTLAGPFQGVLRHPTYSRTGHLIYQRVDASPGIYAVPVDPATFRPVGDPFLVASRGLRPSVAADGTLVYVTDDRWGLRRMSFVDRAGSVVRDVGEPRAMVVQPTVSPDGTRVVFLSKVEDRDELWMLDVANGVERQLTHTGTRGDPAWSPDGATVYFSCGASGKEGGVCRLNADGSGSPTIVVPGASQPNATPDGRSLTYILLAPATRTDVWSSPLDGSSAARVIRQSPGFDFHPRVSPDARWIAFASTESKQSEVYVADYPSARRRWQVSTATAAHPRWHPRGGELFFVDGDGRLQSVRVGEQGPLSKAAVTLDGAALRLHITSGYSVSADGESILTVRDAERGTTKPRITIVENWFAEFAAQK
ncbi:MAG TPA: protein kinase [Vicinamibacterales bacterium]|nr:protein kinase [Vicinamibacterales bacterium]